MEKPQTGRRLRKEGQGMKKHCLGILILLGSIVFLVSAHSVNICFGQASALLADLTVSFKAPSLASQGENISGKIKISVKNQGGLEAKNFHVDIILRESTGTEHMCGRGYIARLRPGESVSSASAMALPCSMPRDIRPGAYQLCAIADTTNVVREANEDNNRVCQGIEITPRVLKPALPPRIPKEPVK
jgi:subtilase family serine protease